MTSLRQRMLEDMQVRRLSLSPNAPTSRPSRGSPATSTGHPSASVPSRSAPTRSTWPPNAAWQRARCSSPWRRSASSIGSRFRSGGPSTTCPPRRRSRSRCRSCSARRKWSSFSTRSSPRSIGPCLWSLWAPSAASKVLWETRLRRPLSCAERIARVFHNTGRIHRPVGPDVPRSRVSAARWFWASLRRGNGVAVLVLMSSSSGGCSARRAYVASSGPSARCGARRGAGGRRWRRPGWGHR